MCGLSSGSMRVFASVPVTRTAREKTLTHRRKGLERKSHMSRRGFVRKRRRVQSSPPTELEPPEGPTTKKSKGGGDSGPNENRSSCTYEWVPGSWGGGGEASTYERFTRRDKN